MAWRCSVCPGGEELFRVSGAHRGPVRDIRITPQKQVITMSDDRTFLVWSPNVWENRVKTAALKLEPEDFERFHLLLKQTEGANVGLAITSLIGAGEDGASFLKGKLQPLKEAPKIDVAKPTPERLQNSRSVEILEHIATPAARAILESLAGGHPEAYLTLEAKDVLVRLAVTP